MQQILCHPGADEGGTKDVLLSARAIFGDTRLQQLQAHSGRTSKRQGSLAAGPDMARFLRWLTSWSDVPPWRSGMPVRMRVMDGVLMFARPQKQRLIVVSNRLPIVLSRTADDQWRSQPGTGGLITALTPLLSQRSAMWIGWPGTVEEQAADLEVALAQATEEFGYALAPVTLTQRERDEFYLGFSNEIIWPLFHDLLTRCNFNPSYWRTYEAVNRKFARVIAQTARSDDFIWVQDYHLIDVASALRELRVDAAIGFFLHIPFPPPDIFLKLPWRLQILRGLLQYGLIGFQTLHDRQNFVQCVQTLLKDVQIRGTGQVIVAHSDGREVRLGSFPVSIDFQAFARQSRTQAVADAARHIHTALPDRQLIFSTDRLDYTKGIPEKLQAFRHALLRFPELRRQVTLIQIVVPSRAGIPEYDELKTQIERLVGEINGQFSQPDWVPIHYMFRSLERAELLAYYRTSEIALITPLKDGMNLVAKEYCACGPEGGVLILSEFAGAAAQLKPGALLVNPYDVEGIAGAIARAWHMPGDERQERMRHMRQAIRERDIFWWGDAFLKAMNADRLADLPPLADDIPADG
jgi:trehalose 6-phosphate synthase/phosphatase